MADFKTVDTSGFDAALQAFAKAMESYANCRDKFERHSKSLLDKWEGKARDEFNTSYNNIQRSLTDNVESLEHIIQNLEAVRQSYLDWDAETATKIDSGT
ncbi:MAG: WXG100 family type VII secretion target [Clostridia bacterium]|nr:WXG100 family type VII secretion target [Clostridia bacterium]